MKYTILGFNQKKAIELGLDLDDLLILRWFIDFYHSGNMLKVMVNQKEYVWVNYSKLIEDIPIIGIKKDSVYRKLKNLCKSGLMEHECLKQGGTFSIYRLMPDYEMLLSSGNHSDSDDDGMEKNPIGYGKKSVVGMEKNPEQNINLLNNYPIKDIRDKDIYIYDSPVKEKKKTYNSLIDDYTANEELRLALKDYVEMRKSMKGYTIRALEMGLRKLDGLALDDETKIAIVNMAIEHSWKSFYPLGDSNRKQEKSKFDGFAF